MAKESKSIKVISVGGTGEGAGPLGGIGMAASVVLFVVNAFTVYLIVSIFFGVFQLVQTYGISGPEAINVANGALSLIGTSASRLTFMLYLDTIAFIFMGVALILVRYKLKQSGSSPVLAAIGAFAFAGIALYVRFSLLPPVMLGFDQIAMSTFPMNAVLFGQVALQLMALATVFLVQIIAFFMFAVFMRSSINKINKSYGKIARGGRLILVLGIVNLIAMGAVYYGTSVLNTTISDVLYNFAHSLPINVDVNSILPVAIALGVGIFLKMVTVPIMSMFAYLSLIFGFKGIAKGS